MSPTQEILLNGLRSPADQEACHAMLIRLTPDEPRRQLAEVCGVCEQTISRWRTRLAQGQPLGGRPRGSRTRLNEAQMQELADALAMLPRLVRLRDVIAQARRRFDVDLPLSTAQRLLAKKLIVLRPDLWCFANEHPTR